MLRSSDQERNRVKRAGQRLYREAAYIVKAIHDQYQPGVSVVGDEDGLSYVDKDAF